VLSTTVPGIPYQAGVVAFNRAGRGSFNEFMVFFSQELIPNKAPDDLSFNRWSPAIVNITWTPLTLFEARGFPEYRVNLIISSTGSPISSVVTNNSFAAFNNLGSNEVYTVAVGVKTGASNELKFANPISGTIVLLLCFSIGSQECVLR